MVSFCLGWVQSNDDATTQAQPVQVYWANKVKPSTKKDEDYALERTANMENIAKEAAHSLGCGEVVIL